MPLELTTTFFSLLLLAHADEQTGAELPFATLIRSAPRIGEEGRRRREEDGGYAVHQRKEVGAACLTMGRRIEAVRLSGRGRTVAAQFAGREEEKEYR